MRRLEELGTVKIIFKFFWKRFNSERGLSPFPFTEELGEMFLPDKGISLVISCIPNLNYWKGCQPDIPGCWDVKAIPFLMIFVCLRNTIWVFPCSLSWETCSPVYIVGFNKCRCQSCWHGDIRCTSWYLHNQLNMTSWGFIFMGVCLKWGECQWKG